jgi:subtilase family serine protease
MQRTRSASLSLPIVPKLILGILIFSTLCFAAAPDRTTGSVAPRGQRPPWAVPENSQGPVPGDTMLEHLTLVLQRSPQQQQAFEQFLQQLQDRSSRNYHHFLTPVQIGQRFGVSQQDIDAVSQWLRAQGLRVDSVANSRTMIDFSGTAAQIGAAFGTEMRYYLVNGEQRIATASEPQIPAAFAEVIQSVIGLYTIRYRPYHRMGQARKLKGGGFDAPALTFGCPTGCANFVMPADFATIYDLNDLSVDGTGQTIGIIGRSRVYGPDIQNFQSLSGLTVNTNTPTVIVPPLGVDPGPPAGEGGTASGDQGEATLDVMRSTSIAPGATIDLIVSASTKTEDGVQIAVEYAVNTSPVPAQIMNISFGSCENPAGGGGGSAEDNYWDSLFSTASGAGISVFVAAGDAGAAGCDPYFSQPPATQYLSINTICASSYATCVGGTEFNDVPEATYWNENAESAPPFESALGPIPEGAWNESTAGYVAAGGGGVSLYIPTPSWQTGTGVPGTAGRYTPDIAFSASAHDGYFGCLAGGGGDCVVSDGSFGFVFFSGTSAAAPDMAGITALLSQYLGSPQGQLNPSLYQLAATPTNLVFNDVTVATSGVSPCVITTPSMCNNSTSSPTALTGGLAGYLVTAGYDEATGLGSINGAKLLAASAPTFSLSTPTTPASAPAGESTTSTFIVTATGGATRFAAPVTFACNGLPDATITCGFSTIAQGASSPQTVTVTFTTKGPNSTSGGTYKPQRKADNRSPWLPLGLPLASIVMVGIAGRKMSKYSLAAGLCVSLVLVGLLVACSSSAPPVAISVSPAGATVWASDANWPPQTATFTPTVTNTGNTAVNWSLTSTVSCTANPSPCGSITSAGVYTSPTAAEGLPGSVTVTATSQADSTKTAPATVTITPTSVPGTYPITVTVTESVTQNTTSNISLTVQ